jgi:putative FmdB family regulatory protein
MPIFEYKCTDCGRVTEVLVSSASVKNPACEHCGSPKTEKQLSTFAPLVKEPPARAGGNCHACPNSTCPHAGH